jgi:receptor protein-tyrosine kinase
MTRLTEALERALLIPPGPADGDQPEPRGSSPEEVLRTWHFDTEDLNAAAPPALRPKKAESLIPPTNFPAAVLDKLVVGDQADPALVEQYRRVAAVLHHAQIQRGVRSVMIASAVAAEGKTLTATNLALTLSHSFDRRVLLIDGDLRRPSIQQMFGLPHSDGLLESLCRPTGGRLPVYAVARNLWVLPAGRPTSDPMSGLVSDQMKQLLSDAVEQFDWVVVDTPPVALMPDANLLARMIDATLLVVSANTTPYPLVQRAVAAIGVERILGAVLNRAEHTALAQYGYYGYYDRHPAPASQPKKRFGWLRR